MYYWLKQNDYYKIIIGYPWGEGIYKGHGGGASYLLITFDSERGH